MKKELIFLTACPDDTYYTWQVHLWLESLRAMNKSNSAKVLIFIPKFREKNLKWQQVIDLYPEAEFIFYKDESGDVSELLQIYIPVLRPYVMARYCHDHPEIKDKAVFYCDSDIIFTDKFNIDHLIGDEINYLSDTNSYINAKYFDSKIRDVKTDMLEAYVKRDILAEVTKLVGVTREKCEENNEHSGGAQYLLKNMDEKFWAKVLYDCINIRTYLREVNRVFFDNEDRGFQSWCADMWAVLWALWERGDETRVVKEMDFAWSTDPITRLETHPILHNAGITAEYIDGVPFFYKAKYQFGMDPMTDPHLDNVLTNETTKCSCNWRYVLELKKLKEQYNLSY